MSHEARGLDAGKRLAERLVGGGDNRSASIVAAIAVEERAHVAVGEKACQHMLIDSIATECSLCLTLVNLLCINQ